MFILTLRTDQPVSELGLFNGQRQVDYFKWQAHRELAETIHRQIKQLLDNNKLKLNDLEGIAIYQGPGSFTGLRIGLSVANALADALQIPIVTVGGDNWLEQAIKRLLKGENQELVLPEYGAQPHITKQKH